MGATWVFFQDVSLDMLRRHTHYQRLTPPLSILSLLRVNLQIDKLDLYIRYVRYRNVHILTVWMKRTHAMNNGDMRVHEKHAVVAALLLCVFIVRVLDKSRHSSSTE